MTRSQRTAVPQPRRVTAHRSDQCFRVAAKRNAVILLALLLGVFALAGEARAQGAMTNGDNHAGTIGLAGEIDAWTFSANAGEHIAITVAEVGNDSAFVPYVRLMSPTGALVAHGWGALAGGVTVTAVTGTYTVLVSSNDAGQDDTGAYILRLAKAPGGFVVPAGDEGGTLTNGGNHAGVIDRGDLDMWSFPANAGDHLALTVAEVGADTGFVPYLRLISPSGAMVAHGWGALAGGVSVAAVTGTYTVMVLSNDAQGDDPGSYILRLAKAPGTFIVPTGDEGGALTNGANQAGVIDRGDLDLWSFPASAGDHLAITVAEVGADTGFVPYLRLISPTGALVAHGWGALAGGVSVAAVTGTYTVIVLSNDAQGDDTGSYILRLAKAPGIFVVPTGDEGGGLTNGGNHAGVIDRGDLDLWSFPANAGDHLAITVAEVGADTGFVPYLRLISPTGALVAHGWGALAGGVSVAAVTGTYTVIVLSNDAQGDDTGSYILRLAKAPGGFAVPTGDEGGALTNSNRSGVIDRGDIDQWSCTAAAGGLLAITIAETGADTAFVPYIRLIGPTGAFLAHGWGATTGAINVTVPQTGEYRLLVMSNDAGGAGEGAYTLTVPACQSAPVPNPRRDTAVDFGQYGLWMRYNHGDATERWQQLDPRNPSAMATGDLDGNDRTDLVVTFPGAGVRAWMNDTEWVQLHTLDATEIVTGDLDGDGHDDAVFSFPGVGLQIWYNNTSWTPLHPLTSAGLATGNLDNDDGGRDDLIVNFQGYGVWRYMNNATWVQLHPLAATDMKTGDVDGSSGDDLVLNFPGYGVWTYFNNNSWSQLHSLNSAAIALANIDGDVAGRKDVIVTFTGYGVWSWMNNASWVRRHPLDAKPIASADIDASGRDDLLLSFNGYGIWLWMNNVSFTQLHALVPDGYVTGRFDDH